MFSGCARDVLRVALGVADRACADGPEGGGAGNRCRISFWSSRPARDMHPLN